MTPLIEVVGLTKRYGRKRGITDVSFEVTEGEVFGFLGPNGAGKTTTMRLLMALLYPERRQRAHRGPGLLAAIGGRQARGGVPAGRARARSQPHGRPDSGLLRQPSRRRRSRVSRALISRLDLDPTRRFRHYSHGNKQKVGLIQAFMHRPRLLILDEPTSGLDPLNQHEFDRMVAEVRGDGRTVFLSSHILSEVESVCDRVGIIRDGRLVRVGGVAELKDIRRHEVDLTFASEPAVDAFRDLAGVERLEALPDGRTLRLIVQGDIDPIVKMAARYHAHHFVSHEPSLEDVFLRFYQDDGGAAREGRTAVWLRSVFLKTLRDCRVPILGWGLGLGVLAPIIFAGVSVLFASEAAREGVLALTRNPVVRVLAEPVDVLSPGGYATWRLAMLLPMLAIWALLAVSRVTRGEEESGALDLLLSVSGSRRRVVMEKLAAIAAALVLIGD